MQPCTGHLKYFTALFLLLLFVQCAGDISEDAKSIGDKEQSNPGELPNYSAANKLSEDSIYKIMQSISIPLEKSNILMNLPARLYKNLINPSENYKNYSTNYKQALNLGIYGADIGYINIYNEADISIDYLISVKKLADNLRIGQFINAEKIKELSDKDNNLDSLIHLSMVGFHKMRKYLREKKRSEISTYILLGSWIESLYLITQIQKTEPDDELAQIIGRQKIAVTQMKSLLGYYESAAAMQKVKKFIHEIDQAYSDVEVIGLEKTTDVENNLLKLVDEEAIVKISSHQIDVITEKVKMLRTELII